jgi:hypothetical protein
LYRVGDYKPAASLFSQLDRQDPSADVRANYVAALAAGGDVDQIAKINPALVAETHELAYNAACGYIEAGQV